MAVTLIPQQDVADALCAGKVGVLPTDTIYGIVARAQDKAAVTRLYGIKHREHKPGTIIAANVEQLIELGILRRYLKPIEQYWPNPLSVVVPAIGPELAYLHQGKQSLAVRIPANEAIQSLLLRTGPLLTSSANQPGKPHARTIAEAETYFGETVDFYVDAGDIHDHIPSTIVRIVDDAIEVLRHGAVTITEQE